MSVTTGDVAADPTSGRKYGRLIDRLHRPGRPRGNLDANARLLRAECGVNQAPHGLHQHEFTVLFRTSARSWGSVGPSVVRAGAVSRLRTADTDDRTGMNRFGAAKRTVAQSCNKATSARPRLERSCRRGSEARTLGGMRLPARYEQRVYAWNRSGASPLKQRRTRVFCSRRGGLEPVNVRLGRDESVEAVPSASGSSRPTADVDGAGMVALKRSLAAAGTLLPVCQIIAGL
jgi:hypothetical protein